MMHKPDNTELKIEDLDQDVEARDQPDLEPTDGELDVVTGGHGPMLSTAINGGQSHPVPN